MTTNDPRSASRPASRARRRVVRYAVVGLGHIAQTAVLPGVAHAKRNSAVTALISDDEQKLTELGRRYEVAHGYRYEQFAECLAKRPDPGHVIDDPPPRGKPEPVHVISPAQPV